MFLLQFIMYSVGLSLHSFQRLDSILQMFYGMLQLGIFFLFSLLQSVQQRRGFRATS